MSTRIAAQLTGATLRRVYYLTEQGLLNHRAWRTGTGSRITWRSIDVTILGVMLDLIDLGATGADLEPLDIPLNLVADPPADGELIVVDRRRGLVRRAEWPPSDSGWWVRARVHQLVESAPGLGGGGVREPQ